MNFYVLIVGIISGFFFMTFDNFTSKYVDKIKILLIIGRVLIFIVPMYFILEEFRTDPPVFFQYAAPFIAMKFIGGVLIRSKKEM